MFGISGPARAGKSTTACDVAEKMGLPYVDARIKGISKDLGLDLVGLIDPAQRLVAQNLLLDAYLELLKSAPRPAITDRTPLDMAVYMMAEINMHSDPELGKGAQKYVERCIHAVEQHFDAIILLSPLKLYVVEEGSAPANRGYQYHTHFLIHGIADHILEERTSVLWVREHDRADRLTIVSQIISTRLAAWEKARKVLRPN